MKLPNFLRPCLFEDPDPSVNVEVRDVEETLRISLPRSLVEMLLEFRGTITFQEDVRTDKRPGYGSASPSFLFGMHTGKFGVLEKNAAYERRLPAALVAIGEMPGGDLICVDRRTSAIYRWVHDAGEGEAGIVLLAQDFDTFVGRLEVFSLPVAPASGTSSLGKLKEMMELRKKP